MAARTNSNSRSLIALRFSQAIRAGPVILIAFDAPLAFGCCPLVGGSPKMRTLAVLAFPDPDLRLADYGVSRAPNKRMARLSSTSRAPGNRAREVCWLHHRP